MATMNVSLPDPMKEWIDERVKSGQYGNVSEYVRNLVRDDQRAEQLRQHLTRELEEGEADLLEGRYTELNSPSQIAEFLNEIFEQAIDDRSASNPESKTPDR